MARGGKRPGAGRPKGKGQFQGDETTVIRVPVRMIPEVQRLLMEEYPAYEKCYEESAMQREKKA